MDKVDISPEAVEAVGYENADGTLYGYANHKSYERNPGAIPVRIVRESDWQAIRSALTASEKRAEHFRKAVERLASSEAFDVSRVIDANRDKELLARMNYAAFSLEAK